MTRATLSLFAVLSFVAMPGCERKSSKSPDEPVAEEADFSPPEEESIGGGEEEEAAPNLSARSDCRAC